MLAAGRPMLLQPFTSMHARTATSSSRSSSRCAWGIESTVAPSVRIADPADTPQACYVPRSGNALQSHQHSAQRRSKHVAKAMKTDDSQYDTCLPLAKPQEKRPGSRRATLQTREEKALPEWVDIRGWHVIVTATKVDIGHVQTVRDFRGPHQVVFCNVMQQLDCSCSFVGACKCVQVCVSVHACVRACKCVFACKCTHAYLRLHVPI